MNFSMLISFADSEKPMIFTKRNDSYLPEPISIENPHYVDCKYVIFNLHKFVPTSYETSNETERLLQTSNCILIIFADLPW